MTFSQGVKFRRGTTAQHDSFTGAEGEITVDTDKKIVVVHDGETQGGHELVGAAVTQSISNKDIVAIGLTVIGVSTFSSNVFVTGISTFTGIGTFGSDLFASGNINDGKGNIRAIPQNSQTSSYPLVASDAGKHISITTGGVTIDASIFSVGDIVTIFNDSGNSQTITQGTNVTLRLAATATTGNRTLAQYGICTILCVTGGANPVFVVSGAGLT